MHLGISTYAPLLIYVGAIIAALLSIFRNPRIGLYFLVPLLPMQTVRYWVHSYPFGEKLVDILLLSVLIGLLVHSEKPVFIGSSLNKVILIFCVLTFLALWEGSFLQDLPLPISFSDERFSNWKNNSVRLGLWGAAITCVYCLIFTFSRGGYLGLLVGILVLGIIRERKLLLCLAVLLFVWEGILPNAVRERVFMTYQEGQGLDSSAQERVAIWTDAVDVITHNPVLGRGFDTYEFMGRVGPYRDTHNYYLKLLVEMGFVGLLVFLWLFASAAGLAWRLFRNANDPLLQAIGCAVFATIVCAAIVNLFGDRWSYLQVSGFLWLFLGMAARGVWLQQETQGLQSVDFVSDIQSPDVA